MKCAAGDRGAVESKLLAEPQAQKIDPAAAESTTLTHK